MGEKTAAIEDDESNRYKAPEVLQGKIGSPTGKSCVNSLGLLLYECLSHRIPFHDLDGLTVGIKVREGEEAAVPGLQQRRIRGTADRTFDEHGYWSLMQ